MLFLATFSDTARLVKYLSGIFGDKYTFMALWQLYYTGRFKWQACEQI